MTDLVNTQRLISDLVNETLARERAELADALANLARERAELADQLAAMLARERAELADLLGALACESADLADPENISNVETDNANDNLARESAELADLLDNLPDVAAKLANITKSDAGRIGGKHKNEATANLQLLDNKITQTQAADMLNVSPRTVATIKAVERAAPDLFEPMAQGSMTANEALNETQRGTIDLDVLVAAYWQKPDLFDALLEAIRESRD